ncbi:copper amine oxidase N-terminal domain-containing protein [Cohnella fermenti]|nr:copper amine oxidase N-terminal domain-containing protein [Cohnella fermenti]
MKRSIARKAVVACAALMLAIPSTFAAAAPTASAAAAAKPIAVTLNGQALTFNVQPSVIGGSTFVEFRSLFAALGYSIDYASKTKTITASSDEHRIVMSIGGDVAFVDGTSVPMSGQVVVKDGRTLVGVRFIATLSGKSVDWAAATRTVVIVDRGPNAEQKRELLSFLDRSEQIFNAEDRNADAVLALIADDSPIRGAMQEKLLAEKDASLQTKTTYREAGVEAYSAKEAVLHVIEDNVKIGGDDYYFDNSSELLLTLHPGVQGEWLLYDMEYVAVQYTGGASLIEETVPVPDADKAAIEAVLKAQLDALNEEDLAAYKATFSGTEGLDAYFAAIESGLADYDQQLQAEKTSIVYYNGTDKAVAIRSIVAEDLEDGFRTRFHQGNYLVKKDGKWLFDGTEYVYNIEALES